MKLTTRLFGLLLTIQSLALSPIGVGNLGRVVQATNHKFSNAVFTPEVSDCSSNSLDSAMATRFTQLRTDVRYLNPAAKECGIKQASPAVVAYLSGTGSLNSSFSGMATGNLVSTPDLPPALNRRMLVTNAHAFRNRKKQMAKLDALGRPSNGPFKFFVEACNKEYEIERVNFGGTNLDKKNDFAFAILKEPVCAAAEPYPIAPVSITTLQGLTAPGAFGLATRQLEGDVCQRSADKSRFVESTNGKGGSADAKLYVAQGELTGAAIVSNPNDPSVAFNMDLLSGGSGGGLFAHPSSGPKRLVGIAVGDGTDESENIGIIFNQKIIDQLRQFANAH